MPSLKSRRVLVTGATGFVGRRLASRLLERGAHVHALVRDSSAASLPGEVATHACDLTDPGSVAGAVADVHPDVVFHLAVTRGDKTAEERAELWRVNALGTLALLEAAADARCSRFVHAGSSLEYGKRETPFRESDALRPNTAFGVSKAAASAAVGQFGLSGRLDTVNLRLFSVYGPGEPSYRLVPTAIRCALVGDVLPLTADGPVRDFVFIDDVCEALLLAATAEGLPAGSVLNVGTGTQTSNSALVDAVERVAGRPIARNLGAYEPHATDKAHWCADTRLAREVLGWHASTPLERGLAKHVEAVSAEMVVPSA